MKKIFIILLLLTSCKTIYNKPVEKIVHDTIVNTQIKTDTTFVKDSIYIYKTADSIIMYQFRDRYKYKYLHDTFYVSKIDSVAYPVDKIVEKEVRYVPWYLKILSFIGTIAALILGVKLYLKFKK